MFPARQWQIADYNPPRVRRGSVVVKSLAAAHVPEGARRGGAAPTRSGDLLDKPPRPDYLSSTLAQRVPNFKFKACEEI